MIEPTPSSTGEPGPASPRTDRTGRYCSLIASGAGALTMLLGLSVLWGYRTSNVSLVQVRPLFMAMQANSAVLFLLNGAALWLLSRRHRRAGLAAGLVMVIAGLTLFEWLSGINLGIDSVLRPLFPHYQGPWPSRLAPMTAIAFSTSGCAIWLSHRQAGRSFSLVPCLLGALVVAIGTAPLFGYLSSFRSAYAFGGLTRMAAHTAAGIVTLGAGILAVGWRPRAKGQRTEAPRRLLLPAGAGMTLVAVLLWRALIAQEEAHMERLVHAALTASLKDIATELGDSVQALSRLGHRIEVYRPTEDQWERDARMLLGNLHYQAIAWTDPSFNPRRVVAADGGPAPRVRDLAAVVTRWEARTAPPQRCEITLIQDSRVIPGGAGTVAIVPVCQGGAVAGIVVGVLRTSELIDAALAHGSGSPYAIAIRADGEPIYGGSGDRESSGDAGLLWAQPQELRSCGLRWVVRVSPKAAMLGEAQSMLPQVALAGGLLVALMLSLAIHFWLTAHRRAEEAEQAIAALALEHTERLRAQEAERDQARVFEAVLGSMDDGVVVVDQAGGPLFFNPAARRMLGVGATDSITQRPLASYGVLRPDMSLLPPEEMPVMRAVHGETVTACELFIRQSGTQGEWVSCNAGPLVDEAGRGKGGVGVFRDVTEQKRAADERCEVARMKDEFVSTVSHELRTPLTSIRGSLGLLAAGLMGPIPAEAQQMLEMAVSNTHRLVRLINDILDIERMESGRVAMEKQDCQAEDLMTQAAGSLLPLASEAGVALEVSPCGVPLRADPDRIVQVLTNLLGNAIKFSPPGSTIRLSCARKGDELVLAVADQGRGIPADKLESIFGRFQQVDSSDARDKGGTGLGLAICRTIAHQHGGRLWVESELGQGSTFFFALPLRPEQADAAPVGELRRPPESPARRASRRALLVH